MARAKHKTRIAPAAASPAAGKARDWRAIGILVLVAVLAAIPFFYGKYREFHTDDPFDSGMNIYTARQILEGGKIGVEVFPSARPATLLANVIGVGLFGYSEFGPKLMQMLMQMAALGLLFYTLRKVYGNLPAAMAVILASFYLSCPFFAKFGNVKEQYMIACMIVAACGLILRHGGGAWWWLVISGGAAINAYYFKQTGVSVAIAMVIYVLAQPILRQRTWREMGKDFLGLGAGILIGLIPLSVFYTWQGCFVPFILEIPRLAINFIFSFFRGTTPAAIGGGSYVGGSKQVSDFANQFATVFRYYQSFVVPIGFGLLAIGWKVTRTIIFNRTRLRAFGLLIALLLVWFLLRSHIRYQLLLDIAVVFLAGFLLYYFHITVNDFQDRLVLLFGIWWLLDMALVWISPRSYVQYYLPLNGSAAMLAGYVLYRCREYRAGYLWLLGSWLVTDFLLLWLEAGDSFLHVGLKSAAPKGYGLHLVYHLIPVVLGAGIYFLLKAADWRAARSVLLFLLCAVMMLVWNRGNLKDFREKIEEVSEQRARHLTPLWQQIGEYIRQHSQPEDGLYVWGWYPGIYVAAERFAPTTYPSEDNMHISGPRGLGKRIQNLVNDLQARPPKFIVDAQKMHYPFYTHPNFELWPRVPGKKEFVPPSMAGEWSEPLNQFVEDYTYQRLTDPARAGGPLAADRARELAREEKARHEAMLPLREFVMQNYTPLDFGAMVAFQYKGK